MRIPGEVEPRDFKCFFPKFISICGLASCEVGWAELVIWGPSKRQQEAGSPRQLGRAGEQSTGHLGVATGVRPLHRQEGGDRTSD